VIHRTDMHVVSHDFVKTGFYL